MTFDDLRATGRHDFGTFKGMPVVAHDDDRWILPVVAAAHDEGQLAVPALLVSLDSHHDACDLRHGLGEIPQVRRDNYPSRQLLGLVESHLSSNDDDWIKAGMELGLFGDAVVWGVDPDGPSLNGGPEYVDHRGVTHKLFINCELPGGQLEFQGSLSDRARGDELQPYWDVLGWEVSSRRVGFGDTPQHLVVNIDLDCFAMVWQGFCFPWKKEVWEARLNKHSTYQVTAGMTGGDVLRELLERASLITVEGSPTSPEDEKREGGSTRMCDITSSETRRRFLRIRTRGLLLRRSVNPEARCGCAGAELARPPV